MQDSAIGHCVFGIQEQIQEDLLQASGIALNQRKVGRKFVVHTNLLEEANFTMKLIAASGGKLHLEMHDIIDVERPPISTIPAYRAMHKLEIDTDAR